MRESKQKRRIKRYARLLFVLYLLVTIYLTLISEELGRNIQGPDIRYNLEPFAEIKRFWYNRDSIGFIPMFVNIFGNILIFAPFGFILPMLTKKKVFKNIFSVTFFAFAFSFAIEMTQMFARIGAFDIDDLMLNVSGAFAGCLIYHICNTIRVLTSKKSR